MSWRHLFPASVLLFSACLTAESGYVGVAFAIAPPDSPVPVVIKWIAPDGPAAMAELEVGDFIKSIDGQPVAAPRVAQQRVQSHRPGDVLVFEVLRPNQGALREFRARVTLGSTPAAYPPHAESSTATLAASAAHPNGGSGRQTTVGYRRYVDPAEQAFDDMVPEGWRVGGRLVRYGPLTIAPFVQAISPDGDIFVQLGDWHIQDFSDMPGWKEGTVYTPGTSIILVRHVQDSTGYARSYGLNFTKWLGCEKPDFVRSENAATPPGLATVPQSHVDTSIAHFICERGGQHYVAQVMATVQSYRLPMSTGWNVLYLASVLARENLGGSGIAVWNQMRNSFRFLPEWNARETAIARQAIKPAQAALDSALHQTQQFDQNVINGSITVHDPATGTQSEIPIGVDPYYFADGQGHFYSSYDPVPKLGFHAVQPRH